MVLAGQYIMLPCYGIASIVIGAEEDERGLERSKEWDFRIKTLCDAIDDLAERGHVDSVNFDVKDNKFVANVTVSSVDNESAGSIKIICSPLLEGSE